MSKLSQAQRLKTFGDIGLSVAAAGTTQATATVLPGDFCTVTSATQGSADGVIMKAGNADSFRIVANHTSGSIYVYPPVGCAFNGAAANAGLLVPPQMSAWFFFMTSSAIASTAGF